MEQLSQARPGMGQRCARLARVVRVGARPDVSLLAARKVRASKHSQPTGGPRCVRRSTSAARWRQLGIVRLLAALLITPVLPTYAQDYYIRDHADRENDVMMPMRDGVRLSADILFPKGQPRKNLPTVLIRKPYLTDTMIEWAEHTQYLASFLANGYAIVFQSERGRYFSEGTYTVLVGSGNDGYDTAEWLTKQPWSNGKVGAFGCSSSAEEQWKLVGTQPPGLATAVPRSSGCGIGKVGPYNEM